MIEGSATACPADDVLAAFVEGRLNSEARAAVEQHLVQCPECLVVVAAAADSLDSSGEGEGETARRWPWLAAAAAVLIAMFAPVLMRQIFDVRDPLQRLRDVSAGAAERPVEARLARFPYAPLSNLRAGVPSEPHHLAIEAEVERINTRGGTDARSLHAQGVASLVTGHYARAVALLQRAAAADPRDAEIWNDLAAAADAAASQSADMRLVAKTAADQAVKFAPGDAAPHFTRAIVLEHLGRTAEAGAEYGRSIELERDAAWRQEAVSRLSRVAR